MGLDLLDLKLIMPEYEQDKPYDIIIVGGGPAGMTAAVYSARKQIRTLLISVDAIGGQLLWTSEIENYMGYQYISGKELTEKFRSQMEQFPIVDIIVGDSVEKLSDGYIILY